MSNRIKLGWFNAWVGLVWIILFIPSFRFIFFYETDLDSIFNKDIVLFQKIICEKDSSRLIIDTNYGEFYYYTKNNFKIIQDRLVNNTNLEIWYNSERRIDNLRMNKQFVLGRNKTELIVFIIALIFSGLILITSIYLIIKTKGWGSYDLMEKNRKNPQFIVGCK